VTRTVEVKTHPAGVAAAPDGATVWVANSGSVASGVASTVTVLDAVTASIASVITVGAGPQSVAFASDGSRAFVTNSTAGTVSVVDAALRAAVQTVDLARVPMMFPFGIAVDATGTRALVTSAGGWRDNALGFVATLDLSDPARVGIGGAIALSGFTGRPAACPASGDVLVPRTRHGGPPSLVRIDCGEGAIVDELYLDGLESAVFGVGVTPDGARAYATLWGRTGGVWIVDLRAWRTLAVLPTVGARVHGVAITPDGAVVVATNFGASSVSLIATATNEPAATVPVGRCPNDVAVVGTRTAFVTNQVDTTVSVIAIPPPSPHSR
jgi:YVTN family beta-propeller protein